MSTRRFTLTLLFFITLSALFFYSPASSFTQDNFNYESERQRALGLFKANNLVEAKPILEKLYAIRSDDAAVLEALAFATTVTVITEKDVEKQKNTLLRARSLAERAKELGNNSQLVQLLLEQIPPNGEMALLPSEANSSPSGKAMQEGEIAFSTGQMEQAIEHYERAAQLDPKLYEAPLFIGDAYYSMGKKDKAYEYYALAVAIDPDRDTAYRYWGNVLMSENKLAEAKNKLIEGIIAAPYSRLPWQFLTNWAERSGVQLVHPRIDIPTDSVQKKGDKNITIMINPASGKEDGSTAWMMYSINRASWMMDDKKLFFEAFPNEKEYRHSLHEECSALNLVITSVKIQLEGGDLQESDLNVSIVNLLKLHRDGLLETYVLLAIPDEGIAQDYAEYRKNNRDKLRRYLNEYVTSGK